MNNDKKKSSKDKKNDLINNTLKRKSILPSFISLLVCFILLLLCGTAYCGCILNILRGYKDDNYKSLVDNYINILQNDINNNDIQNYIQQTSNFDYLYVLDKDKNIISSNDTTNTDYQSLIDKGIFYDDSQFTINSISDFSLFDIFKSIKSVISAYDTSLIVWYENPLDINEWTILIGRDTSKDSDILMILSLSMELLWVLISTQILIIILFIITGALNKRKLKKVLYLDTVTGGNNWLKFKMDASTELKKGKNLYALVSFDVYKFRIYCDINGHIQGDDALIEIDHIMKKFINKKEFYAHKNLDTFDMFLLYKDEKSMRERLLEFSNQLQQSEKLKNMRFAFGVYVVQNKNISINRMSMMANMSKDNVKLQDFNLKETISFFNSDMHQKIIKESDIFNNFNQAIENQQFLLYIQPKYDLITETLSAGEALVRWRDSDGNLIKPIEFIPVFEKNGCIRTLDKYMLEAVCKKQREWLDMGYDIVPISVNLSRACFSDKSLVKDILRLVDSYKVPHNKIELELTESAFFDNKELLINTVQQLRKFGFSVSMDDFGAGYSSLNSLKELPIDIVKLDGGFFKDIKSSELEKSHIIIHNIIKLAYDLNLRVVAEGVETQEQIDFLRSIEYDILIQGYYFSKPIPNEDFEKLQSQKND